MTRIHPIVATSFLLLIALVSATTSRSLRAGELRVGAATADITPDKPVALSGFRNVRISKKPSSRIYVSAIALETRDGDASEDEAIMVSCDLVAIRDGVLDMVREKAGPRLPDFDIDKLFLSATHTHTGPVTTENQSKLWKGERYKLPEEGIVQPADYTDWMTDRIADAAVEAWENRAPGQVAWGQSQAVIAQNRRPYYADGTAKMYGNTNSPDFRGIEGHEDHSLDVLYFWDAEDRLTATIVNVPSPSQEIGGKAALSLHADFWDPTRRMLREKHGEDLHIVAWCGAGGDVTSKQAYGKAAEARMRKLKGGISRLDEIARRIVQGWEDALDGAQHDKRGDIVFEHTVKTIDLPFRQITEAERDEASVAVAKAEGNDSPVQRWNYLWNKSVVDRYDAQQAGDVPPYPMELHALRLGDVAIGTNNFELYSDYGIQMKARSPGIQTFVIQLCGAGTYVPTKRAVELGGYGAVPQSSHVGPVGGQVLVNESVKAWKAMWDKGE